MASSSSSAPKLNSGLVLDVEALRRRNNADINNILEKLEKTGLLPLLTAHTERYLEEDVAEFYANASVDQKNFSIKSTVNGQAVEVTPAILCDCFNLPVHGVEDVKGYGGTEELSVWHDITGTTTGMSFPFKKDILKPQFRMLADIVGKILECRAGSHDRVTKLRFKIMTLILVEEKVNWSLVLFNFLCEEMRFKKRIFGILLGYILTKMHLNLRPGRIIHKNKFLFHGDLGTKKGAKSQTSGESAVRMVTALSPTARAGDEAESTPQTGPAPSQPAAPTGVTQTAQLEAMMARLVQGSEPAHPRDQPSASSSIPCAKGSSSKAPQSSRPAQTQGEDSDAGSSHSEALGINEELLQELDQEGAASDINWNLIEGQGGHFYALFFLSGSASAHKLIGRKILKVMGELLQHPFAKEGQSYTTWRRLRMALPYSSGTNRLWNFCRIMEPNIMEWTGNPSIYENLKTNLLPRTILEKRCGIIRTQIAEMKSECSGSSWSQTICSTVEAIFNRYMVNLRAAIAEVQEEESFLARDFVPVPAPPIRIPNVEVPLSPPLSLIADSELQGDETAEVPDPYKQAQQGTAPVEEEADEEDNTPLIRKRRGEPGEGTSSSLPTAAPSSSPSAAESTPPPLTQDAQPLPTIPEEAHDPVEPAGAAASTPTPAEPIVETETNQGDMIEAMQMLHELTGEEPEATREEASPEVQAHISQLESAILEETPADDPATAPVTISSSTSLEAPAAPEDPEPSLEGKALTEPTTAPSDKGKGLLSEEAPIIPYARPADADDRIPIEGLESLFQNMERLQREYAHIAAEQKESQRGIFEYMYKMQEELQKVLKFENSLKKDAADAMASMRNGIETRLLRIENTVANQIPDYFNQRISTLSGQVERLDSSFQNTRTSILQALTSQDARLRLLEADIQEVRTLVRMLLPDDKKGEGKGKGKGKSPPPPDPSKERKRKFMGDAFPSSRKR